MGRNIFQSDDPEAMIRAVGAVVHESVKPQDGIRPVFNGNTRPQPAGGQR